MRSPTLDDPDLSLSDLMAQWPQTIPVFLRHRMLCVGCLVNPFHTLSDACTEYSLDRDEFQAELRRAITDKA
jgi:hybrid cluster-associated redox disulfide protein